MPRYYTTPPTIGQRFERLTVIAEAPRRNTMRESRRAWSCKCDCGNILDVIQYSLISGNTQSCGCLKREQASRRMSTHGLSTIPEFFLWKTMRQRCTNPNSDDYPNYGGRGIRICDQWDSFETFIADMGYRPSAHHTLERKDNNGSYSPDNCTWATRDDQANNQRQNRRITFRGRTQTYEQWTKELGWPANTVGRRLRDGWTVERALTQPLRTGRYSSAS